MPRYGFADGAPTFGSFAQLAGDEPYLVNPLVPMGKTRMYKHPTLGYRPTPGQLIARYTNSDGSPALDITAAALPLGAWSEVWTSGILPDWILTPNMRLGVSGDAKLSNPSPSGTAKMRLTIRNSASSGGDENDGILAHATTASTTGRGLSRGIALVHLLDGTVYGNSGPSWWNSATHARRAIGTYSASSGTRLRLDVTPAQASDVIQLFEVSLFSE